MHAYTLHKGICVYRAHTWHVQISPVRFLDSGLANLAPPPSARDFCLFPPFPICLLPCLEACSSVCPVGWGGAGGTVLGQDCCITPLPKNSFHHPPPNIWNPLTAALLQPVCQMYCIVMGQPVITSSWEEELEKLGPHTGQQPDFFLWGCKIFGGGQGT